MNQRRQEQEQQQLKLTHPHRAGELRDLIYTEALASDEEVLIDAQHHHLQHHQRSSIQRPALLLTCRQISYEATKIYYSRTRFRILTHQNSPLTCVHFLHALSPRTRRCLRHVTISFVVAAQSHAGWTYARYADRAKELQAVMASESRYRQDKRRVEMLQMLEELATMKDLRPDALVFETDGMDAATRARSMRGRHCWVAWVHLLVERLREMDGVFRNAGLARGCQWCEFGREVDAGDGGMHGVGVAVLSDP